MFYMKNASHLYRVLFTTLVAFAAGCAPQVRQPPPLATAFPPNFPAALYSTLPREAVYRVIPDRSTLILKVHRAGALASFGHNHVIESHIDGFVYLAEELANARADLFVVVANFVVDDPAARAAAGPDFETLPTASDIEGTRTNMLGPKLLDADRSPYIVVHVVPGQVGEQSTQVQVSIQIRDHVATLPVGVLWSRNRDELSVHATFAIDHAVLGLEPFSALGGVLRVAEKIDVAVSLVAKTIQ